MGARGRRDLVYRARRLDREASFDLARTLHPESLTAFVRAVCPVTTPSCALFDVLADAYSALQICNQGREAP